MIEMDYQTVLICVAFVVVSILLFILTMYFNADKLKGENEAPRARAAAAVPREGVPGGIHRARNVRARMRARMHANANDEDEEEIDDLADEIAMPEGKVGVKKRRKLEMKAEKKRERERELDEREERRLRQKEIDERRKLEDEKQKEEELKKEEEEKALKEEQERKELEEYLKMKESFAVEEEGFDQEEPSEEENKFQEFINYIKSQKVVLLEDLASRFKLKTQEAIDRVQDLLNQEWLVGVIDDRGKFIYVTREELESVALFIRQRGRVSIAELVECSNSLINLQPEAVEVSS